MEAKKPVTFDDIARYTQFSKTTVSRYFNHPESLTPRTRQIISQALEELDYRENRVARLLATGRTDFIGVLVPEFYHRFYSEVLNQLLATYDRFGYKFLVFVGDGSKEAQRRYLRELLSYRVEGLIVLSHALSSRELARFPIPVVTIEREDRFISSVNTDNYAGGRQAAQLLEEQQCQVFLHINSPTDPHVPASGRIRGFVDYCRERGLAHELVLRQLDRSYEEDQSILKELLAEWDGKYPGRRLGIFLANDTTANTLLNLIIRRYGHLPPEYRIIGFDNSPTSREAILPLSTVGQQADLLAREAVELLVEQLQARQEGRTGGKPVHKVVPPILFHRATTGGEDA